MTSSRTSQLTFLFTDIEGSTRLWEEHDRLMEPVLSRHDQILHRAVSDWQGTIFKHTGDGLAAAFPDPGCAINAALQAQQHLAQESWKPVGEIRARMGLHTGQAQHRDGEYFGRDVNRASRIMDAAHGGQILLSKATAELSATSAEEDCSVRDLGVHQLKDLSQPERVFQLCHPRLHQVFPPLRTIDSAPRQIPSLTECFVGRASEIRMMRKLLSSGRLVVMTGPGGVGKTQLAIATATDRLRDFPDGAWFCPVGHLSTTKEVAEHIQAVMGLRVNEETGAVERLLSGIASRRTLIILDGAEDAQAQVKELIARLLDACPNVSVICTSRAMLHARYEQVLAVGPLAVPDGAGDDLRSLSTVESVALFEQRARLADSKFTLTPENLQAVASICRRLDGLPLAVELAAAQMSALHPQDLAERIDQRIGLVDDREQTLRSIIEWSYGALSKRERILFHRLSVFSGGFSLTMAEKVCADEHMTGEEVMPCLADLVGQSVIAVQQTGEGNRYHMLELLRSYAWNQVKDAAETRDWRQNHLNAYLEFLAEARAGLFTRFEADWVTRIEVDFANIRWAFTWAMESGQLEKALELIHYLDAFARERMRREIDTWAEQALELASGEETYLFAAQAILASTAARRGDLPEALRLSDEAVASVRKLQLADAFMPYQQAAIAGVLAADTEHTSRVTSEAIERASAEGLDREVARFTVLKAHGLGLQGDLGAADEHARKALDQARSIRNPSLLAWCLYAAGAYETEDSFALAMLEEAVDFASMVGNQYILGIALQVMSWRKKNSSPDEIAAGYSRVISHWYRVANWTNLASTLRMCAESIQELDDELVAVIDGWLGHDDQHTFGGIPDERYAGVVNRARMRMGEGSFRRAASIGATFDNSELVRYCTEALDRHTQTS